MDSIKRVLMHFISFTDIRMCKEFNEDFDGDQMAVHIPLSFRGSSGGLFTYVFSYESHVSYYCRSHSVPTQYMLIELFENLI